MYFSNSIILAAFAAISQVSAAIHFSSYPQTAVPSTPTTLEWTGGDTTSTITITLKKAGSVVAVLLQRNGQATSFDWTPAGTLQSGSDYTLEITQGTATSDTPEFTVGAATTSSSTVASATTASTATVTATTIATSAVVTSLSTVAVTTTAAPVTTIAPIGNITSSGSILPISTFTTLPINATSTVGSGSNSTASSSSSSSSPTPTNTINPSSGASNLGSSLSLIIGAAAAIAYFC